MILPDFMLTTRANQLWETTGMDSIEYCLSESYFKRYPYELSYKFNSRGFRDEEWPDSIEKLKNCIWCFGDSFTTGVGCPYEYIWTTKLEKLTGIRTINVSLDGASNSWISRKVLRVIEEIDPKLIVIHWSYFSRRESEDTSLTDEERRIDCLTEEDYRNNKHKEYLLENLKDTLKNVKKVESSNHSANIVHSIICDEVCFYPYSTRKTIHKSMSSLCKNYLPFMERLDYGRDGLHYGVKTSELFAIKLLDPLFKNLKG